MSTSFVDAKAPEKQNPTEKQEVSVIIFINVIFSLLSNKGSRNKNDKGMIDSTDLIGAMADLVKEHPCYHANISLDKNPDKIYSYECYVPCEDLYFNDNGECIDPIGSFSKILYACMELDDYLGEQVFPSESKIQVCINVMGFESIEDLAWGFAFLADACCPNNVEDKILNELIMDDYEPFFIEYIKNRWKINVTYISLLELGIVYEVYDKKKTSAAAPSNMIDKNSNKKEDNANPKNGNIKDEKNVDIVDNVDNKNIIEEAPITLKGYVSKTHVDLSSFLSFDQIIDTIPPFGAIRFLDRLMGVDKIEKKITDNTNKSIDAFINGDSEGGWNYLKEAGGASLDYIHKRLDVLAFAPVVGSVAGVVDGWIYTVQEGFAFRDGDWDKGNELKKQALWAYAGAVPFYKIFKYGKPVWKSGKAITEGSRYIVKAEQSLIKAQRAYKEANTATKALKEATKAVRKPAISNRYAKKRAMREAEDLLNKAKNDPQYIKALEEYGIKFEDAIAGYRANFWEKIRVLYGKKTPVADFVETFIKQMCNPNSVTREAVKNSVHPND